MCSAVSQLLWGRLNPCTAPMGSCGWSESTAIGYSLLTWAWIRRYIRHPTDVPTYKMAPTIQRHVSQDLDSARGCPLSALWYYQRQTSHVPGNGQFVLTTTTTSFRPTISSCETTWDVPLKQTLAASVAMTCIRGVILSQIRPRLVLWYIVPRSLVPTLPLKSD